jgi:hypothetical protein
MTEKDFKKLITEFNYDIHDINDTASMLCRTCTSSLDEFIDIISNTMMNDVTNGSLSDADLDFFILNLPIYIYHASTQLERLGLNEDISAMKKKESVMRTLEHSNFSGNAQSRLTMAELENADAVVLNILFARAYKMAKAKLDSAYEILASCKKVMSRRIEELKAFNSDTKTVQNY